MPKYKLTYFDGRGRAEVSRMLFAQAGQEYEDERIQEDSWGAMKPKTPFGQLPLLEVDGLVLCQSNAIARYLAKSFGLAGKTELDQAKADMIVDTLEDMIKPLLRIHQEQDKGRKGELQQKSSEDVQTCLQGFEKLLTGDFFLGDEMTWADFTLVEYIMWPPQVGVAVNLDKHPKIKALIKRVETSPKIAEWIKKRPKSDW